MRYVRVNVRSSVFQETCRVCGVKLPCHLQPEVPGAGGCSCEGCADDRKRREAIVAGYGQWSLTLEEDDAAEFVRKVNAGEMRDKDGKPWPETRAWIAR